MTLQLEVQQLSRCATPAPEQLTRWAELALEGCDAELCLRIVDEEEMRSLNHRYRRQDRSTNVLAFTLRPTPALPGEQPSGRQQCGGGTNTKSAPAATKSRAPLGDIVICAPLVLREARDGGKSPDAHWAHLLTHGLLHLLGYDHENPQDAHRMERKERELLARMSFPDPYTDSPGAPPAPGTP